MTYRDSQGRRWQLRRPNGWPIDKKAPDGFTVNGFRRVTKARTFWFVGTCWVSDFEPGSILYVQLDCGWATSVSAAPIDQSIWTPDTINDGWRDFIEHIHDKERTIIIRNERK